jgi:DNA-binding transcriptional LysR family regulator
MELRQLRYFVIVAEQLHFRHAAEIVRVAQPALSQQIQQLEKEIGVVLLERSRHKVVLTAAGKAFYKYAQGILNQASRAVVQARQVQQGDAGTIRIGFVSTAMISILPEAMKGLQAAIPSVEFELKELGPADQIAALYLDQLDVGFFHATRLREDALAVVVVAKERIVAAVPTSCELARKGTIEMKDLAPWTAIMPAINSMSGFLENVRMAYQSAGVVPERIHHTGLLQTGLILVGAGMGVSLVPASFKSIRVRGVAYKDR